MSYCKLGMVFHRKLLFDEFVVHFEKRGRGDYEVERPSKRHK